MGTAVRLGACGILLAALVAAPGCRDADQRSPTNGDATERVDASAAESVARGARYHKRVALVIGIDRYPKPFALLERAVNDARSVRNALVDELGYVPDAVRVLENEQATRSGIAESLTSWLDQQRLTTDDSVLLFFAGHGDRGYLAAGDSKKEQISETWLSMDFVVQQLERQPCRHKLIILDSCYSGTLFAVKGTAAGLARSTDDNAEPSTLRMRGGPSWGRSALADYYQQPCFLAITAGRDTAVTDELGEDGHSLFTGSLLESIKERALTEREDQIFLGGMLAVDVERRVMSVRQSPQRVGWGYRGPGGGDFVFTPSHLRETLQQRVHTQTTKLECKAFASALRTAMEDWKAGASVDAASKVFARYANDPAFNTRFDLQLAADFIYGRRSQVVRRVALDGEAVIDLAVSKDAKLVAVLTGKGVRIVSLEDGAQLAFLPRFGDENAWRKCDCRFLDDGSRDLSLRMGQKP